jgi:hypothetical protein
VGAIVGDRRCSKFSALMTYHPIFPAALQPVATALLHALRAGETSRATPGFTVLVRGEQLSAPGRVYYAPDDLRSVIARSDGDARILALCLGTRHWDGYVREECVRQIVGIDRPWVVPFVVQLLGEYVLEIVDVVAAAIPGVNAVQFSEFARENRGFMATTRRRMTSYWDCYFRGRFPTLQTCPAFIALEVIEGLAGPA